MRHRFGSEDDSKKNQGPNGEPSSAEVCNGTGAAESKADNVRDKEVLNSLRLCGTPAHSSTCWASGEKTITTVGNTCTVIITLTSCESQLI